MDCFLNSILNQCSSVCRGSIDSYLDAPYVEGDILPPKSSKLPLEPMHTL